MPGPISKPMSAEATSKVWLTLITRSSYFPGAVLLVHTLHKHQSRHIIVVQYTSTLEKDCIACLYSLTALYPRQRVQKVDQVPLPPGLTPLAKRFDDTLTKLRAFEPLEISNASIQPKLDTMPTEVCFLDADIMIFRNMDDVFNIPRPGPDWIAAQHACKCNIDNDPWAPSDWNPKNCPITPLIHPSALDAPIPSSSVDGAPPIHQMLNSGVFVCSPSQDLWKRILHFLSRDERVKTFVFPDQDFLDVFFRDHWVLIGWQYNALKTHRYWHSSAWRDDEVRALHYIVDKPWEARVAEDGTARYLGRDGETHSWWWAEYTAWEQKMADQGANDALECVKRYVCVDFKLGQTRYQS